MEDKFPNARQWAESYIASDHTPVILELKRPNTTKQARRFRFENMWTTTEGFWSSVEQWWKEIDVEGNGVYVMATKPRSISKKLSSWAKSHFGSIREQKQTVLAILDELAYKEQDGDWSMSDVQYRNKLEQDYEAILHKEEIMWKQRAKIKWLREGDRNTAYFHKIASGRKRKKCITSLNAGQQNIRGDEALSKHITEFYASLFAGKANWQLHLDWNRVFEPVREVDFTQLEQQFTDTEILLAIHGMDSNSSPGPDGFPASFFKHSWKFIKNDILSMFHDIAENPN
jgi:hypothetical protein